MENFKITSAVRKDSGKGAARRIRAEGRLPAVLYGRNETPVELAIGEADMRAILHAHPESAIVDLDIEGGKSGVNAIVRDVQRHPATGRLLHVDFQRISLDEKVRVEVQIELQGTPTGVKDQGGVLEHGTRSLNVMCLPGAIPESITLDVSGLEISDSISLGDVASRYPDLEFLDDEESTLVTVLAPTMEKVEEEAEEGEEAKEPELVSDEEKKEKEEDEEGS
jgi:large subunit ribosomal protein L25